MDWEHEVRYNRMMRAPEPLPWRALRFWRIVSGVLTIVCGVLLLTLLARSPCTMPPLGW